MASTQLPTPSASQPSLACRPGGHVTLFHSRRSAAQVHSYTVAGRQRPRPLRSTARAHTWFLTQLGQRQPMPRPAPHPTRYPTRYHPLPGKCRHGTPLSSTPHPPLPLMVTSPGCSASSAQGRSAGRTYAAPALPYRPVTRHASTHRHASSRPGQARRAAGQLHKAAACSQSAGRAGPAPVALVGAATPTAPRAAAPCHATPCHSAACCPDLAMPCSPCAKGGRARAYWQVSQGMEGRSVGRAVAESGAPNARRHTCAARPCAGAGAGGCCA